MSQKTVPSLKNVIVHNGKHIPIQEDWQQSQKEFLLHFNEGVYTVTRTIKHQVFDPPTHFKRLSTGLHSKIESFNSEDEDVTIKHLSSIFRKQLKIGSDAFFSSIDESELNTELKIAMLVEMSPSLGKNLEELESKSWVYISPFLVIPKDTVAIQIRSLHRNNPEVKSLQWIRDRAELEKQLPSDCEECVLVSGNDLYEGLSSNFFCLKNGTVYIAPEGTILEGTIMKLVFATCEENNIPVIRDYPNLSEIEQWQGCFISSTSRSVLPVKHVYLTEENREIDMPISPIIDVIREGVNQRIFSKCEPIR